MTAQARANKGWQDFQNVMARAMAECPYCGATEGLRVKCDGGGYIAPEYTCEACFTPTDTGPCFDDLPAA